MAEEDSKKSTSPWPILAALGVAFLPGLLLGTVLWGMLRWGRHRPGVIAITALGIVLTSVAAVLLGDFLGLFLGAVATFSWPASLLEMLPLWLAVSFILGAPLGYASAAFSAYQMRKNPHLVALEGDWRYNFKFHPTPLENLRFRRTVASLKKGELGSHDRAPLGVEVAMPRGVVNRYDSEAQKHTLITGNAGSGKSITMQSLILSDIEAGKTVVVIDFKRSPRFAAKLAAWSEEEGANFYHFVNGEPEDYDIPRSQGQCYYDPLKSGTPTSKADMVLGMREYDTSSAVYRTAMQQLLQVSFSMLHYADPKAAPSIDWNHGGIYQLASAFSRANFDRLVEACTIEVPPGASKWTYEQPNRSTISPGSRTVQVNTPVASAALELQETLRGKTPVSNAVTELQGQMRTIIASEYGRWMKTGVQEEDREIDLMELTKAGGNVILFSLNSDSEPEFAQYVGSMILADLTSVSARRRNAPITNQINVYIDEFQAVPPDTVTSLLEKARESKMGLTLAQQSFDQIVSSAERAGEAYLNSILDTCSNFITHAGSTLDSATRVAKILGMHRVASYTKTNKNESSFLSFNWANKRDSNIVTREEERWRFDPSEFMVLSSPEANNGYRSTAVVTNKTSADPEKKNDGPVARTVWMVPNERVLQEYYTGGEKESSRAQESITLPPMVRATTEVELSAAPERYNDPMVDHLALKREKQAQTSAGIDPLARFSAPVPRRPEPEEDYGEEEEELDGGYSWDALPEEEPTEGDSFTAVPLTQAPQDLTSMFSSSAPPVSKASPPATKETPETKGLPRTSLPNRPTGLPTRPTSKKPEADDDIALPELF